MAYPLTARTEFAAMDRLARLERMSARAREPKRWTTMMSTRPATSSRSRAYARPPGFAGSFVMRPAGIEPATFRSGGERLSPLPPPVDETRNRSRSSPVWALLSTGGDTRPLCNGFADVAWLTALIGATVAPSLRRCAVTDRTADLLKSGSPRDGDELMRRAPSLTSTGAHSLTSSPVSSLRGIDNACCFFGLG